MSRRKYPPSYYRYRREHPAVVVRLTESLKKSLDVYRGELSYGKAIRKLLEEKADLIKLKAEVEEARRRSYEEGFSAALQMFIENPWGFYKRVVETVKAQRLKGFEPALFMVPCSICGEPMVFTHKDDEWVEKVKPELLNAFKKWYHVKCKKPR
jgi:hypothetical protein